MISVLEGTWSGSSLPTRSSSEGGKRSGRGCKDGSKHEMGASGGLELELDGKKIAKYRATNATPRFISTLRNSSVGRGRLTRPCRNPDWQPVLRRQEVGALALIYRKHVEPRGFTQFEFMGILRSARTKQSLPFRSTRHILDVRSIAIGQAKVLHEVLHAAIWTFDIEASF
jgi:hypothetical protein